MCCQSWANRGKGRRFVQRTDSLEKTLMLGKTEGKRMRWLDSITDSVGVNFSRPETPQWSCTSLAHTE